MARELGFRDKGPGRAELRVSKIADTREVLNFGTGYDFVGWSGVFTIRADEDTSALLTVNTTPTAAGSKVEFFGETITLLLKAADLATLPDDGTDTADPWGGVFDWTITDPTTSDTSRILAGPLIAEKR